MVDPINPEEKPVSVAPPLATQRGAARWWQRMPLSNLQIMLILLIIVAIAMVAFPIGWSIPGLAPAVVGGLMIVHHLRVTRGPALEGGVQA